MIRKLNNKKGITFLGEKTFEILIAALCILFLTILLVSLYFNFKKAGKAEQAQFTLDGEKGKGGIIEAINSGKSYSDYPVSSPTDWYIFGFVSPLPDSCVGEKCICICEKTAKTTFLFKEEVIMKSQLEKCDKGACSKVPNLKEAFTIKIEPGKVTSLSIIQSGGVVEIKRN